METVFLLTLISHITLTDIYEVAVEGSFATGEECVAAGAELVTERSTELAATGAEGFVWFHCTEAAGIAIAVVQ